MLRKRTQMIVEAHTILYVIGVQSKNPCRILLWG